MRRTKCKRETDDTRLNKQQGYTGDLRHTGETSIKRRNSNEMTKTLSWKQACSGQEQPLYLTVTR